MILCRYNNRWHIAQRAQPALPGCSLRIGANMTGGEDWKEYFSGSFRHKYFDSFEGITFYPELRYRRLPVLVWNGWHPESQEPLLGCMLGDVKPMIEAESGVTHAMIVQANDRRTEDEHRWKQVHDRREAASRKIMQRVIDDGWKQEDRGLYFQYIHVDDLEKIEGPPPEESF